MTAFLQPSSQRLDRWLEHNPNRFERYLTAHPEVADHYDQRTLLGDRVREALVAAVDAPLDLAERLRGRFKADHDTSISAVGLDLLGLGLATVQSFLEPDPSNDALH